MTYEEAIRYLDSFLNYEQITTYRYPGDFSLDRMERFLHRLGNPHRRYPELHVAGTKGKGSTCAFAASILRASGLRVGLYTSPHLLSFRERFQINGHPIEEERLGRVVAEIEPKAARDLTYFEVTTGCAFLYFAEEGVDAAVVEVGMGGRLDATNLLTPEVTAITPISLDHVPRLGRTLREIAREKAGIIKPAVPLVLAPQEPEALSVFQQRAQELQVRLHPITSEVGAEILSVSSQGTWVRLSTPQGDYPRVFVPLLGRHQIQNASMALRMAEIFSAPRGGIRSGAVQEGIAQTHWPGRLQLVNSFKVPVLLDGAQNAASADALRRAAAELFPGKRILLIFGASTEKDLGGMARILGPWVSKLLLTQAQVPRAESPERLAEAFQVWHSQPEIVSTVQEALERALQEAAPEDLIVVAGSLFVAAEALRLAQGASGASGEIEPLLLSRLK